MARRGALVTLLAFLASAEARPLFLAKGYAAP